MDRRDFVRLGASVAAGAAVGPLLHACKLESRRELADIGFVRLRNRYFREQLVLNPVTSTYLGGDGWDPQLRTLNGRLRDYSAGAMEDEARSYRELDRAYQSLDQSLLTTQGRVDYAVMGSQLAFLRRQMERRYHERAVDTYVAEPFRGIDWHLQQMRVFGNGMLGDQGEWRLLVTRLNAIPSYLAVAQQNLAAGRRTGNMPDPRMVRLDGIAGSRANAAYFRTTLPTLAKSYLDTQPFAGSMLAGIAGAGDEAARAYEEFALWLERTFPQNDRMDRFALGATEYEWRIRTVLRDDRSAGDLYEYAARQVDEYTERIGEVAGRLAAQRGISLPLGTAQDRAWSIRRVMEDLAGEAPSSDDELLAWYRETAGRAVAYGRAQELFDVPADYQLEIQPTPPLLRNTIDAAYYPAPPLKRGGAGRFYLTPTGNDSAALRGHPRASVAATAVHEGFPGHDWHYRYMAARGNEISNIRWLPCGAVEDSSSMWSDSMAVEGWGLYVEELMAEPALQRPYGFYSAGEYLYELQGQLLRAARVRIDVGLHTGRMSFDDAVRYYTERVSFYPDACARAASDPAARVICDAAVRAIYRYSKWPTQALTYNLGKNAILSLRDSYRSRKGTAYSQREFHEQFLQQGPIPPAFFRDALLSA